MADELPEVRQCQDTDNWQYGAVAVAAGANRWGVMTPVNGGHWADDDEVESWARVIKDPAWKPPAEAATETPEPEKKPAKKAAAHA
jgi:hypothetical protein